MNTLSDTDEGRARPSVWPVYLAAVVVVIVGLMLLPQCLVLTEMEQSEREALLYIPFLAGTAFGLFGVVTGVGMILLRPWAWWCGILFAGGGAVSAGMGLRGMLILTSSEEAEFALARTAAAFAAVFIGLVATLLIVILATRRQLFFPPKPKGEELGQIGKGARQMDTVRDTDEGRATRSVWPVYLVAAIIGLLSLGDLGFAVLSPVTTPFIREAVREAAPPVSPEVLPALEFRIAMAAYAPLLAVYGIFGVLTAVGMVRLRPWGWWCGGVWTMLYAVSCILMVMALPVRSPAWSIALSGVTIVLFIWPLSTRRRLFFPPKPASEEWPPNATAGPSLTKRE